MMKFLGIDPGYGRCGWGAIEDNGTLKNINCGVIETPSTLPFSQRLAGILSSVKVLIQTIKPDCLAIEKPVHGQNVTNSVEVGAAFGAVLLACEEMGIEARIYYPTTVKAAVLKGNAKKAEVQAQVKLILGLAKTPKPDDAADGLAIAICAANRYQMDKLKKLL